MNKKEALIVGIDPGSTSAVAAFNLDGELKLLESRKEFSQDEVIRQLIETGRPVVIASDRERMPSTVEKISSSRGAQRFEPENDLRSQRKNRIGKGENSHEIDAYASGIHAYNSLQKEIRKIEKISEKTRQDRKEVAKKYFSDKGLDTENIRI